MSSTLILLCYSLLPLTIIAQPGQPPAVRNEPPAEPETVRIYQLSYADSQEIAVTIKQILHRAKVTPAVRTNSVVVSGSKTEIDQAESLIKRLDVPVKEQQGSDLAVLPLRFREADQVARRLNEIFGQQPIRIAADQARSTIVVSGQKNLIERATSILQQLDTPQQGAQLEFAMLYTTTKTGKSNEDELDELSQPLPADLADVGKELGRFGDVRLLARLSTAAIEDRSYSVEGTVGRLINLQIEGKLLNSSPGGAVRLDVAVTMLETQRSANRATSKPASSPGLLFRLTTAVTAQRGDTVVLGTAPTGWLPGRSAIVVVRLAK